MKKYVEEYVKKEELTDLDLEYPYYDKEGNANEVASLGYSISSTVPSIDIVHVITILEDLKDAGATRVYIREHCDHVGYEFHGVKLIATDE